MVLDGAEDYPGQVGQVEDHHLTMNPGVLVTFLLPGRTEAIWCYPDELEPATEEDYDAQRCIHELAE